MLLTPLGFTAPIFWTIFSIAILLAWVASLIRNKFDRKVARIIVLALWGALAVTFALYSGNFSFGAVVGHLIISAGLFGPVVGLAWFLPASMDQYLRRLALICAAAFVSVFAFFLAAFSCMILFDLGECIPTV